MVASDKYLETSINSHTSECKCILTSGLVSTTIPRTVSSTEGIYCKKEEHEWVTEEHEWVTAETQDKRVEQSSTILSLLRYS